MESSQQRSNLINQKLADLSENLKQLKTIQQSQKMDPSFQKSNDAVLGRADAMKMLTELKSIRQKIVKFEQERTKEKQHLFDARKQIKNELALIKKELLVENFQSTPAQFRIYLKTQLQLLKTELISLSSNECLQRVKSELIQIRAETAAKLEELKKYKQFEQEFESYKQSLKDKLLLIKAEVSKYEQGIERENEEYKAGKRIPKLLQNTITSRLSQLKEEIFRIETENKTYKMNKDRIPSNVSYSLYVNVVDLHIGGQCLRIVQNGIPKLEGSTLLEKRQYMQTSLDYYRKFLIHEPRGFINMSGVIITEADNKNEADFGVLFMHNQGYPSMCGSAILGIAKYAYDYLDYAQNRTLRIQCPSGIVTVVRDGDSVGYESSPAWAEYTATHINLDQFGSVEIDIGYGGSYYAICPSTRFNLNVRDSAVDDLINICGLIKQTVTKKLSLSTAESEIDGIILTDGMGGSSNECTANVCVFADRQLDRSPTPSGIVARLAVEFQKNNVQIGQKRKFVGKSGSIFEGEIVKVLKNYKNKKNAVIVKVTGSAKYIGRSEFVLENNDQLGRGFLMK